MYVQIRDTQVVNAGTADHLGNDRSSQESGTTFVIWRPEMHWHDLV